MDREEIVEEVARALAAGQLPGCAELEERFPGEEEQVVRLTEAAEVYRDLFPLEQPKRVSLLRPGEQLGEFEVVELIGRGATSEVYSARQVSLGGRMVALKVVPLRPGTDVTNRRFEREARLLASLHHPSLAEVYRCGEEGGLSYLAMRLVGGPTLRDRMSSSDGEQPQLLTAREIAIRVGWVIQVAEALEVVHRAGLVHRDVKPANILVERSGDSETPTERAILVDFGLVRAHQESDLTATGSFPATYAYAAPEQIEGRELDSSCDVFSLGVTLHELLSGETPSRRPPAALGLGSPAYLDPNLRAVIECATDPDPRWRYEHAGLLAEELRAWLAGEKVAVRRPPPLERSQRWLRRNQRGLRVALAGALALGLVAILAVLIQRWQQDEARAQRARDAFQGGEPLIFAEQVAGIAPMWRLSYFSDAECRAAVESLDDPESTAAIMGTLLSNVNQAGASEVAAARLRRFGFTSELFALRFLEHGVRSVEPEAQAGGSSAEDVALHYSMRLLVERGARTVEEYRALSGLRQALESVWLTPDASRARRLAAVAALSGSARAREVSSMVKWAKQFPGGSEERRIGLASAERAVRTLHRAGLAHTLDFEDLWRAIEGDLRRNQPSWPEFPGGPLNTSDGKEYVALAGSLGFAEREATGLTSLGDLLSPAWHSDVLEGKVLTGSARLLVGAALDGSTPGLFEGHESGALRASPEYYGWMAGCKGDSTLARTWREQIASAENREAALARFDRGLQMGSERFRGEHPESEPDAETLLGSSSHNGTFVSLEGKWSATASPETVALWDFAQIPAEFVGSARGAQSRDADPFQGELGEWCLRANHFGHSRVRLDWELPELSRSAATLELVHLAALRPWLPDEGVVYMAVFLDGEWLGSLSVPDRSWTTHSLPVRQGLMTAGRHTLTMHSLGQTTSTYRLLRVRLSSAQ